MPEQVMLTAADPEPPAGTIVRDDTGCRWVRQPFRVPCGWISEHDVNAADPESWRKVAGNYGPVVVLSVPPQPAPPPADLAQRIRDRLERDYENAACLLTERCGVTGFDEMRAAILAVVDGHAADAAGDCRRCVDWDEDEDGYLKACRFGDCPTLLAIARSLGIKVPA